MLYVVQYFTEYRYLWLQRRVVVVIILSHQSQTSPPTFRVDPTNCRRGKLWVVAMEWALDLAIHPPMDEWPLANGMPLIRSVLSRRCKTT